MKTQILDILGGAQNRKITNSYLKITPFVSFLEQKSLEKQNEELPFFKDALAAIKKINGWNERITYKDIPRFEKAFGLVYQAFSEPAADEGNDIWALSNPFTGMVFFGTAAFYDLLTNPDGTLRENLKEQSNVEEREAIRLKLIYSVILQKLYGISPSLKNEMVYSYSDYNTELNKYYRLHFDIQFIEVTHKGSLPPLEFSPFRPYKSDIVKDIEVLKEILPLDKFSFEGFSIVHITDVTNDYVIDQIKNNIVNLASGQQVYEDIGYYLRNLFGDDSIRVRLFPIRKVNEQLAKDQFNNLEQMLNERCTKYDFDRTHYWEAINEYIKEPQLLFYPDINEAWDSESKLIPFLKKMCIKSFALIPIKFHHKLVGILEVLSDQKDRLTDTKLAILNPVLPLLERLLKTIIDDFDLTIDNIIKEKFTSLQPSVQWRFNEAAWHYLQKREVERDAEIERVYFKEVYPLYGAIDVRNSTIKRNKALQNDLCNRMRALMNLLQKMQQTLKMGLLDELLFKAGKWYQKINSGITSEDEYHLSGFFKDEAEPLISHLNKPGNPLNAEIGKYFRATEPDGEFGSNRADLEHSLMRINQTVQGDLTMMNEQIQEVYPCYFEKYRTDGMEYDLYIGQSITPQKEFIPQYLKNLRLLQLSSMADIAKHTHQLLSQLPKKLETTQLIFIHANTIDISFRNDERRFDVEGAYNIRYEMAKKRIDKVHIKDTMERLTQPGKIALVYFKQEDIEDYESYISYLQDHGVLQEEVEYLELEDLQGLTGLKALRLTVKI